MKNIKSMFFIALLILLLLGVTTISASDVSNNVNDTNYQQDMVTDEMDSIQSGSATKNIEKQNINLNTKTDTETTNYYVSNDGKDENTGTEDSPFLTIQTAIDKTTEDKQYNIYIAEGVYKGQGNTNLSVPGNNYIHFIGSGINKTVLDGEVEYTVAGGNAWGSDTIWNSYNIISGNWGLNITQGNGKIIIENLNIENMVSRGGSSISLYETATIDNYANLEVNNVKFFNNLAGVGAGIRNNDGATLQVNNSIFQENRKSSSTGNYGAGIYNNGTATVINSQFIKNIARWGTITNDNLITIINCTLCDGIAYELGSTYKGGAGVYSNTGVSDYNNLHSISGIKTVIENSTFINNSLIDIYKGSADLIVNNNIFNQSVGIYAKAAGVTNISNNQMINLKPSSLFGDLQGANSKSFGIIALNNSNIVNNSISLQERGYAIDTGSNSTILNNTLFNNVCIVNENIVKNNSIITNDEYAIEVSGINNIITDNYLIASFTESNNAVNNINDNVVENNTPDAVDSVTIIVTDENYSEFFNEDGTVKTEKIPSGSTIKFSGEIINKKFIINNTKLFLKNNESNATLTNCQIITEDAGRISATDLRINNINTTYPAIILNSTQNILYTPSVNINTTDSIHAIEINADYNTIRTAKINLNSSSNAIRYDEENNEIIDTVGLLIRGSNNIFSQILVSVNDTVKEDKGAIIGILLQGTKNNPIKDNQLDMIRVTCDGDEYVYGLVLSNAQNTLFTSDQSDIQLYSNNYANCLKIYGNSPNNVMASQDYMHFSIYKSSVGDYVLINGTNGNTDGTTLYIDILPITSFNDVERVVNTENTNNIRLFSKNILFNNPNENRTIYQLTNTTNSYIADGGYANSRYVFDNSTLIKLQNSNNNFFDNVIGNNINIELINSNDNTIENSNINAQLFNIVNSHNNNIINNTIFVGRLMGDEIRQLDDGSNIIENNTPRRLILTMDNYDTYFDEGILNVTFDRIDLGSDLFNKNLTFTHTLNFTNPDNYTIYNGTIKIENAGSNTPSTNKINITHINIYNTDNRESSIIVNNSHTNFTENNIYQEGNNKNVIVLSNSTFVNNVFSRNNITVIGDNNVVVYTNAMFYTNNRFGYNSIKANGNDVTVIYCANGKTFSVQYNNITVTSDTPTTAVLARSATQFNFQNNRVLIDTDNGETPIIRSDARGNINNNYIEAHDIYGDDAIRTTGTKRNNTPTGHGVTIEIEDKSPIIQAMTTNLQVITKDTFGNPINGSIVAKYDEEEIEYDEGVIIFTPQSIGEHTLEVTFTNEEEGYETTTITKTITVESLQYLLDYIDDLQDQIENLKEQLNATKETTIIIDPLEGVQYGDEITISGTLVNEDSLSLSNQNVTIVFNDEETTVTTRNGEFKYTTTATVLGENTITATYAGSDKYVESEATATFTVDKANAYIELNALEAVKKGDVISIGGVLYDHNNNTLANKVVRLLVNNGRKTVKTNDMGEFLFEYTTTKVGNITLSATFEETDLYKEFTVETTFEVKALATEITFDDMGSFIKGNEATISGTLTDEKGNAIANAQVKLLINGSPKTLKTDSEGRFTHTYTFGQVGENTIAVTYAGSANYEATSVETVVNVTKTEATITIAPIEEVTVGSTVTISGTLTYADGNLIANAQVKVLINSSPKTLKTDEFGAFTHTFKMTKEGTNNITAIFNGNNDYSAAETNSTVMVIKAE